MTSRDEFHGIPTEADFRLLSGAGTESRRRFQYWISAAAIATIALSIQLVENPGIERWLLGGGLVCLLVAVGIAALDRAAKLELLLQGAKYTERIANGEKLPPMRRRVLRHFSAENQGSPPLGKGFRSSLLGHSLASRLRPLGFGRL